MTDELLGPVHVEHDASVGLARGHQRDPARDVRLDQAGDDVDARTLRRDHEVDPDGARHLRDPADRVLDVARRHHHQVGELVDHDHDERHVLVLVLVADREPERAGLEALLVAVDVADADGREHLVAHLHLADDPLERLGRALGCTITGLSRCGTSAKWLSSTRFGSTSTSRTSSGVVRIRIDVMKQFTRLDLPAPVAPAISTCGIVARFTICDRPWTSLPRATVSGWVASCAALRAQDVAQHHEVAVLVRHLDADRRLARGSAP